MKRAISTLIIISILGLAACVPASGGIQPTETTQASPTPVTPSPIPTEAAPTPTHIPVDLTPALRAAMQALASDQNIPIDQIHLVSTQAMSWPTGCLGVVIPGVMCTRGPVDGFQIILEANGEQFEYHTNQDGTSVINAAQQMATIRLVVSASDHAIQVVDPNIPLGPTYNPSFDGFLPAGGAVNGAAYVLDLSNPVQAESVDANGAHLLSFIQNPTYGLALWRGGPDSAPRLAWGTQLSGENQTSSLQISNLDGSQLETLLTQEANGTPPVQLVAERWSSDGQWLYYSQEPVGLGGYIPFAGASSLYRINITSKQVEALIPWEVTSGTTACLDAISNDYRFVAEHCSPGTITIRDLNGGETTLIQPPADLPGSHLLGSARFSPDGKQVAFALANGDPNHEQGWVAVADIASGEAKLILTGQTGAYYTVAGWLDDQTLLVQSTSTTCNPNCESQLWVVGSDGSNPHNAAQGSFLTVIDNR
jgi:hypothetical protein